MNEKIKELAEQAGFEEQTHFIDSWECGVKDLERFAELIRQDEREACAKLCENVSELTNRTFQGVADAIRAMGEK